MGEEASSASARARDEAWVLAARAGDPEAFGRLFGAWIDRVYDLARRITRDDTAAADVAQDAFLAAWRALDTLEQPGSFGGWLLRITRNRAYNRQRDERRSSPFDDEGLVMIERARAEERVEALDEPAALAADSEAAALVWESVEALSPRDAEVLELTLRAGMDPADVAELLGTNRNAANQMLHRARTHLGDAVRARVLWRGGEPECGNLADVLAAAGVMRFDRDAVRVTTTHADGCELCARRRRLRLDPAVLFGAVPVVAAPSLLRTKVAHALAADGVPMAGVPTDGGAGDDGARIPGVRRWLRVLVAAAVVVVLALATVVVVAEATDDAPAPKRTAIEEATSVPLAAAASTTVAPPPPEGPATSPPSTTAAAPTAPPPTAPPPVVATMTVTPATAGTFYSKAGGVAPPLLAWRVTGPVATVAVAGPGYTGSGATGSATVCPSASTPTWTVCVTSAGDYTYVLTARGADGAVVATTTATLRIA